MLETPKPEIQVADAELHQLTAQAWDAIAGSNDPPRTFVRGGRLTCVREEPLTGSAVLSLHDKDSLSELMSETAAWRRMGRNEISVVHPPDRVAKIVLGWSPLRYAGAPPLDRVARTPFFAPIPGRSVWEGGARLVTEPGYHPEARTWYDPDPDFEGLRVGGSNRDLSVARATIQGVLGDFPFSSHVSRAHAVALLLLPFVRELIYGDTPMHLITAPAPGTGKGLLADVLLMAAERQVPRTVAASNDEEWRKRITSELMEAPSVILIDNIPSVPGLDSPTMASVLTCGGLWRDRILGKSEMATLPVRGVFVATGNNVQVSNESARRVCRIHLDRGVEDPAAATDFRIPNLLAWAEGHRAELAWAALTLVQAWLNADHPDAYDSWDNEFRPIQGGRLKQSYIEWSRIIGGILLNAGITGFLEPDESLRDTTEVDELSAFFAAWAEEFPEAASADEVSLRMTILGGRMNVARPTDLVGVDGPRLQQKFRYWVRSNRGRVAGGLKLVAVRGRQTRWTVVPS